MVPANLCTVILTLNEERHIARAINSAKNIRSSILIVDSYSEDRTITIAKDLGAIVLQRKFTNYATQFDWALNRVPQKYEWILRLDADEYLSDELVNELNCFLGKPPKDVNGVTLNRCIVFLERPLKHGGLFPRKMLRLFRRGTGRIENRWMDEHILVQGKIVNLRGILYDHNLKSLTWWTQKHNWYSSREVLDLIINTNQLDPAVASTSSNHPFLQRQARANRLLKQKLYLNLPSGLRAVAYFIYRYFFRLGFLDGKEGLLFHCLQGLWYRLLVDAKLQEVKTYQLRHDCDIHHAAEVVLGIETRKP